MANLSIRVMPEISRSIAFGAIGVAYAGIGSAFANPVHWYLLQNLTDKILMFSWDGINDHFPLPANGYVIMDVTANKTSMGGAFYIAQGTRFYVKEIGAAAPTSGSVYLSVFYGSNY